MAQDLSFGLSLNASRFDAAMRGVSAQIRALANQRMTVLRSELKGATSNVATLDRTKVSNISREFSQLSRLIRQTNDTAKATKSTFSTLFSGALFGGAAGAGFAGLTSIIRSASTATTGLLGQIRAGITDNAALETTLTTFTSLTGSAERAAAVVDRLRRRADVTPFNTAEVISAGQSLFTSSNNDPAKMMELLGIAERLAVLNPVEGLKGAAFALKEAVSGDFTSLAERFNIGRSEINALKDAGKTGQQIVEAVLKARNIGQEAVDSLGKTFSGRLSTIVSTLENTRRTVFSALFAQLSTRLGAAGDWLTTNGERIQTIASGLGLQLAALWDRALSAMPVLLEHASRLPFYVKSVSAVVRSIWGDVTAGFNMTFGLLDRVGGWLYKSGAQVSILASGLMERALSAFSFLKSEGALIWRNIIAGFHWMTGQALNILNTLLTAASYMPGTNKQLLSAAQALVGQAITSNAQATTANQQSLATAASARSAAAETFSRNMSTTDIASVDQIRAIQALPDTLSGITTAAYRAQFAAATAGMGTGPGVLDQLFAAGQAAQAAQRGQIAQGNAQFAADAANRPAPADARQTDPKLREAAQRLNQTNSGRNRRPRPRAMNITFTSLDGNISPVSVS